MPAVLPPSTLAESAKLDIAEAETLRRETVRGAYESAKKSAHARTAAAKKLSVEVRKLDKAADCFFLNAEAEKKKAKWYHHELNKGSTDPMVKGEAAASDRKKQRQGKTS